MNVVAFKCSTGKYKSFGEFTTKQSGKTANAVAYGINYTFTDVKTEECVICGGSRHTTNDKVCVIMPANSFA